MKYSGNHPESIMRHSLNITRSRGNKLYIFAVFTRFKELAKRIDKVSGEYEDEEEFIKAFNCVFEVEEPDKTEIKWTHTRGACMYPAGDILFTTKCKILYDKKS